VIGKAVERARDDRRLVEGNRALAQACLHPNPALPDRLGDALLVASHGAVGPVAVTDPRRDVSRPVFGRDVIGAEHHPEFEFAHACLRLRQADQRRSLLRSRQEGGVDVGHIRQCRLHRTHARQDRVHHWCGPRRLTHLSALSFDGLPGE
jgi:hypothetical protein